MQPPSAPGGVAPAAGRPLVGGPGQGGAATGEPLTLSILHASSNALPSLTPICFDLISQEAPRPLYLPTTPGDLASDAVRPLMGGDAAAGEPQTLSILQASSNALPSLTPSCFDLFSQEPPHVRCTCPHHQEAWHQMQCALPWEEMQQQVSP